MAFMCGKGGRSLAGHQCGGRNGRCTGTHFELPPNSIGFSFFFDFISLNVYRQQAIMPGACGRLLLADMLCFCRRSMNALFVWVVVWLRC